MITYILNSIGSKSMRNKIRIVIRRVKIFGKGEGIQSQESNEIFIKTDDTSRGNKGEKGGEIFSPTKPTIVIVSHEASITGAPLLAYNLTKGLKEDYNIITVLLRGPLSKSFKRTRYWY